MSQPHPHPQASAELHAIHAAWLSNPNPSVAAARAYRRALQDWRLRHYPDTPPDEEYEIQTLRQLEAWCQHRQELCQELESDPNLLTMPPIVVGFVRFAWECLRRLSPDEDYPPEPAPPRGYAGGVRLLDRVIVACRERTGPAHITFPSAQQPATAQQANRVQLRGSGQQPTVLGVAKPALGSVQYNVVEALINAGPNGLAKDALIAESGHEDAVNVLKRLARSDADWAKVIHLPGKPWVHYRIG